MIFFDFDGTVVNVWSRYYQVFLAAAGATGISQNDYIRAKQMLISDENVAHYLGINLPAWYFSKKRDLLEADVYLQLDTLLAPIDELNTIFSRFECRFLTTRRRPNKFFMELKNLGLDHLSSRAIVLSPDRGISKKEFLMRNFPQSSHIVVGDSKSEWETAFLNNVHVVLVRTGLCRPEDFLLSEHHTIVASISEFIMSYLEGSIHLWT